MTSSRTHTWVINLDRSPERLAVISAALDRLGIPWTRHRAVDARALKPEQSRKLDADTFRRWHGMEPALGEVGCYLSHVEVMQAFLHTDKDFAVILEDDAQPTARLPAVLAALEAHAGRWDMVKLSAVHSGTPQPVLRLTPDTELAVMLTRCTGSSAYIINRHAAEVYLRGLLPIQLPYDHVFDQGWTFDLRVRLASPPPIGHPQDNETTIVVTKSRKFPWHRRLTTHVVRARNELRRVRYAWRELRNERHRAGA